MRAELRVDGGGHTQGRVCLRSLCSEHGLPRALAASVTSERRANRCAITLDKLPDLPNGRVGRLELVATRRVPASWNPRATAYYYCSKSPAPTPAPHTPHPEPAGGRGTSALAAMQKVAADQLAADKKAWLQQPREDGECPPVNSDAAAPPVTHRTLTVTFGRAWQGVSQFRLPHSVGSAKRPLRARWHRLRS